MPNFRDGIILASARTFLSDRRARPREREKEEQQLAAAVAIRMQNSSPIMMQFRDFYIIYAFRYVRAG